MGTHSNGQSGLGGQLVHTVIVSPHITRCSATYILYLLLMHTAPVPPPPPPSRACCMTLHTALSCICPSNTNSPANRLGHKGIFGPVAGHSVECMSQGAVWSIQAPAVKHHTGHSHVGPLGFTNHRKRGGKVDRQSHPSTLPQLT